MDCGHGSGRGTRSTPATGLNCTVEIVQTRPGHQFLIFARLPSRGEHQLDFIGRQVPVAVTDPDEASLGDARALPVTRFPNQLSPRACSLA
jgi:hypothetical protein